MPLNIRNEEVNALAAQLAARKHINKTEAVKYALQNELRRSEEVIPLSERLKPLCQKIKAYSDSDLNADKAFFDDLSGDY
jgi:antitoxin VapB